MTDAEKFEMIVTILWFRYYHSHNCFYCGRGFGKRVQKSWDHVIPKCRGGLNRSFNKVQACTECNNKKCHYSVEEFRNKSFVSLGAEFYFERVRRQNRKHFDTFKRAMLDGGVLDLQEQWELQEFGPHGET